MRSLRASLVRLAELFKKEQREKDLAEELESHLQMHIDDNLRSGMNAEEARRAAIIKLGGVEQTKEAYRDRRIPALETYFRDVQYGLRLTRKNPGFSTAIILTLALGIGANTAIFSIVNAMLLQPLPYARPDRLVWMTQFLPKIKSSVVPSPSFLAWEDQNHTFQSMAAYGGPWNANITGEGEPERIPAIAVSANFFSLLGVEPVIGRSFLPAEALSGARQVAIVTDPYWRNELQGNPAALGKAITLDGKGYTIVGILPSSFKFPADSEPKIMVPLTLPMKPDWTAKNIAAVNVIARLKPGVALEQAKSEIATINRQIEPNYPAAFGHIISGIELKVIPLQEELTGKVRIILLVLLGSVVLVLLIACVNVANLQLSRAATRKREMAIRAALGAGRSRLLVQLLVESVVLALIGGAFGLLLGRLGITALHKMGVNYIPDIGNIHLDLPVFLFTLVIALSAGIFAGLPPAIVGSKRDISETLKKSRSLVGVGGHGPRRFHDVLVVSELAMALVLLIASGLLLRSFHLLTTIDPGFGPRNLLTMRIDLPQFKYATASQQRAFFQQLLSKVESLPGINSAAMVSSLPLSSGIRTGTLALQNQAVAPAGAAPTVATAATSFDYFHTMEIPLLAGRGFSEYDNDESPLVAIVNESFVRRFLSGNALGTRIRVGAPAQPWLTIVGVVADVRQLGLNREAPPEVFTPYLQDASPYMALTVRTTSKSLAYAQSVIREVRAMDRDQAVYEVTTMEQRLADAVARERLSMVSMMMFAGMAFLLAMIGIYGVLAYSVTERTHEIGVRVALGAQGHDVVRLVVARGIVLALAGIVIGVLGALGLTRVLAGLLFEIRPTDLATFVAVSIVLGGVAFVASYIPAQRATKLDPIEALRHE